MKLFASTCSVDNSVGMAGLAVLVERVDTEDLPQKSSSNPIFPWLGRLQHQLDSTCMVRRPLPSCLVMGMLSSGMQLAGITHPEVQVGVLLTVLGSV